MSIGKEAPATSMGMKSDAGHERKVEDTERQLDEAKHLSSIMIFFISIHLFYVFFLDKEKKSQNIFFCCITIIKKNLSI